MSTFPGNEELDHNDYTASDNMVDLLMSSEAFQIGAGKPENLEGINVREIYGLMMSIFP